MKLGGSEALTDIRLAWMLDYLGETQAAQMLETAVWQAFENKRFGLTAAGSIDGKMKTAIRAFQDELKKVLSGKVMSIFFV